MPWVAFVYLMGHMLYSHLYRELYPVPGIVDVTGAQMVLVMKVGDTPSSSSSLGDILTRFCSGS